MKAKGKGDMLLFQNFGIVIDIFTSFQPSNASQIAYTTMHVFEDKTEIKIVKVVTLLI
jgi:hypothetical protein